MTRFFSTALLSTLACLPSVTATTAFLPPSSCRNGGATARSKTTTTTSVNMMIDGPSIMAEASSSSSPLFLSSSPSLTLLSTIDSEIANIPTNEFATIFAGGIMVMMGGLASALVVGFILEKNDMYAQVIAESYAEQEGVDNEDAFWQGLSDEERKKAKDILRKVKENNERGRSDVKEGGDEDAVVAAAAAAAVASEALQVETTSSAAASAQEGDRTTDKGESGSAKESKVGMFSDY